MSGIKEQQKNIGYVTEHSSVKYDGRYGPEINLGLATSPLGPAPELSEPLRRRDPITELSEYPYDPLHIQTRQLVIEGLGLQNVNYESLLFVDNGSYGAGDEIIRYLSHIGVKQLYAPAYSFPNVAQWTERHNMKYKTLPEEDLNPLHSLENVFSLSRKDLNGSVVYIDYPNNPYGIADSQLLRKVIDYVSQNQGIPFVDLAFGEVLGQEFTDAIQYTIDHGGICLGSLSKTQGLPGLRTGYAILPDWMKGNGYSGSQRMVFGLNREAEFVYQKLFDKNNKGENIATKHATRVAEYNESANTHLINQLRELGLKVGITDMRTPIQVVISDKHDFYDSLAKHGVITESLEDYSITLQNGNGYGNSAVRMLTPRPEEMDETIRRIAIAVS